MTEVRYILAGNDGIPSHSFNPGERTSGHSTTVNRKIAQFVQIVNTESSVQISVQSRSKSD